MRVLFFDHEQYTGFEDEPGNLEVRQPMLESGAISAHRDFVYQRVKRESGIGEMIRQATDQVVDFDPDLIVNVTSWPQDNIPAKLLKGFEESGHPVLTIAWDTYPGPLPAQARQNAWFEAGSYFCDACSFFSYARYRMWAEMLGLSKGVIYLAGHNVLADRFAGRDINRKVEKDLDVTLVGSLYARRIKLIEYLRENLAGHGITVTHLGGLFDESKGEAIAGRSADWLPFDDYLDVVHRSKILLCPAGAEGQWAVRGKIFEFLAAGAFCLAEGNLDVAYTVPDDMLATYRSDQECLEKIIYFMTDDGARQRLGDAGRDWYRETYDTKRFWADFLDGVGSGRFAFANTGFVEERYQMTRQHFLDALAGQAPKREHFLNMEFGIG